MNIVKRIILSGAAAAIALSPIAISAAGASASQAPVVYQNGGWSDYKVAPERIYISGDGSLWIGSAHWNYYSSFTAGANAKVHFISPSCTTPSYECPVLKRKVSLYMHRLRHHNGIPYYSRMRMTFRNGRVAYFRVSRGFWNTNSSI